MLRRLRDGAAPALRRRGVQAQLAQAEAQQAAERAAAEAQAARTAQTTAEEQATDAQRERPRTAERERNQARAPAQHRTAAADRRDAQVEELRGELARVRAELEQARTEVLPWTLDADQAAMVAGDEKCPASDWQGTSHPVSLPAPSGTSHAVLAATGDSALASANIPGDGGGPAVLPWLAAHHAASSPDMSVPSTRGERHSASPPGE